MSDKPKIMVVDDNPMNLDILVEVLQDQYQLERAEDGTTALAIAPAFEPDVVLLDVMMPGRDGFDVCRCIKQHRSLRQARIIMVSARADLASRLKGYDAGADDYVTKPFDEDELLTKIVFALRTKRLQGLCGATGEMLALLSELRDTDIDPHIESVRTIGNLLALELAGDPGMGQIDDQFLDDLNHATMLRDVGMLSIPESVRDKEGNWSTDELEHLKQHTLVGSSLLNRLAEEHPGVSVFRMAADVARSHHEQHDGGGYPDKLTADQIPLSARIVHAAEIIQCVLEEELCAVDDSARFAADSALASRLTLCDPRFVSAAARLMGKVRETVDLDNLIRAH